MGKGYVSTGTIQRLLSRGRSMEYVARRYRISVDQVKKQLQTKRKRARYGLRADSTIASLEKCRKNGHRLVSSGRPERTTIHIAPRPTKPGVRTLCQVVIGEDWRLVDPSRNSVTCIRCKKGFGIMPSEKRRTVLKREIVKFCEKHGGHWHGEYKKYPVKDWMDDVKNGNTRLGYWEAAYRKSEELEEELEDGR